MSSLSISRLPVRASLIAAAALAAATMGHAQLTGTVYLDDNYSTDASINPADNYGSDQDVWEFIGGSWYDLGSQDPNIIFGSGATDTYVSGAGYLGPAPASEADYFASLPQANFSSSAIDYQSPVGGYDVGGFLNNPVFTNEKNGFSPTANLDNTLIQLTGSVYLNAGVNTFTVGHDDGIEITVAGIGSVVNQPFGTSYVLTPFDIDVATAGNYDVTMDYTECCGPPAYFVTQLNGQPITIVAAPDIASTLSLLGLALGALVAASRRFSLA